MPARTGSTIAHGRARLRRTRRTPVRRVCAFSVVVALLFSLVAAPLATAAGQKSAASSDAFSGFEPVPEPMIRPARPGGQSAQAVTPLAADEVFAHGFETWPGQWTIHAGGTWGQTSYRAASGSYSAYCVGATTPAPGPYPTELSEWMIAGPFDLSTYDAGEFAFDMWLKTEPGYDYLYAGVSTDGTSFDVMGASGDSSGWTSEAFNLADFYSDGTLDVTGEPAVWIAFIFESDASYTDEGAYIDNVSITTEEAVEPLPPILLVAGDTRFETAVEASKLAYPGGAQTVVIATGRNWPDALGGSALAGALGGPILLTEPGSLPPAVSAEITRLGATHAVILGGTSAVGIPVENALKAKVSVERIAGTDRYDTANKVARRVITELGGAYDGTAFVATGGNFPDALAAAPLAAANGWPLFLSNPAGGISSATRTAMAGVTDVFILGGTGAVPATVETNLGTWGFFTDRIAGSTRYDTAAKIAEYGVMYTGLMWNRVGIATGENYPDALAGGVLQGAVGSVMLLTPTASLCVEAGYKLLNNRADISTVTFFGGMGAVSQVTRNSVAAALAGTWKPPQPPPTGTDGVWEGYTNGYSDPVVLFNVKNNTITTTGSTLENGASLIVVFPYNNVTIVTYVYANIPIGADGKFSYTWGTVTAPGGQKWVSGTVSSNTQASGTATHQENSFNMSGNMTYSWTASR